MTTPWKWASTLFAVVALGLVLAIRLSNSTLTETQLFIVFWPVWLAFLLFALAIAFWTRGGRGR